MTARIDPALVLGTCLRDIEGMSESEKAQENEFLALRQQFINGLYAGRVTPSEVLEVIEYTGISPEDYVDAVVANIEALERGRVKLNNEPLTLVPQKVRVVFY